MTLDGVVAEFERLLAEAHEYPVDSHGYPGQEAAHSWYRRERDTNLWARTLLERIAPARLDSIPWGPSVVSQFPSDDWRHRVRHLERLVGALRNLRDEVNLLGAPPVVRTAPTAPVGKGSGWLSRHGWPAIGTVLTGVGLLLTIAIALAWGPF